MDNSDDEGDEQDYCAIRDHWSNFAAGGDSSGINISGPRTDSNSNSNSNAGSRGPFASYLPASWTQRDPPEIHGVYQNTSRPRKMGAGSHYTTFDPSEGIERRAQMREGESVALLYREHRYRWQRTCISSAVFFVLGLVVTLYLVWFYRNQAFSSSSSGSL